MNDAPGDKVESFLEKQEDILTSVARSIGSTLGTVAAKVNAVSKPSRRKAATRKRRPTAKAAKRKRPAKKSKRPAKAKSRKRTTRKKSRR
jgi:hypothetical protein